MSKYFYFKSNEFHVKKGVRPGNQSAPETLKKLSIKYQELDNNSNVIQTPVGRKLIEISASTSTGKHVPLKANKIDIAHGISIANIKQVIAAAMTQKKAWSIIKDCVESFGLAMFSITSEKKKLNEFFKNVSRWNAQQIMNEADILVDMLNSAVNNLMGGNSSTNRSIGSSNDPHAVLLTIEAHEPPIPTTLPEYTKIKTFFENLAACFNLEFEKEETICKASTISCDHQKSVLDKSLFSGKISEIIERQSNALEDVKRAKKSNNVAPHENSKFEDVCNDFEILNQTGLTSFVSQYPDTHQSLLEENLDLAAFQERLDLNERYGIDVKNIPNRTGILGADYDDEEDPENDSQSSDNNSVLSQTSCSMFNGGQKKLSRGLEKTTTHYSFTKKSNGK